jgi:hypothetical protein
LSRGTRYALVVIGVYVVECVVLKLTAADAADADASIVIGAFTTAFGAGLLALAFQSDYVTAMRLRWLLRRDAVAVPATVAAVVTFHSSDFNYPVFEYTTPDGATHRHADATSRSLAVGATADVRYRPEDADHAVGPLGRFNVLVFGILAGLGTMFAAIMPILTLQALFG